MFSDWTSVLDVLLGKLLWGGHQATYLPAKVVALNIWTLLIQSIIQFSSLECLQQNIWRHYLDSDQCLDRLDFGLFTDIDLVSIFEWFGFFDCSHVGLSSQIRAWGMRSCPSTIDVRVRKDSRRWWAGQLSLTFTYVHDYYYLLICATVKALATSSIRSETPT